MKGKLNLPQKLGLLLILASCVVLLGSELMAADSRSAARETADRLRGLIAQRTEGDPGSYSNTVMPVLQIDGTDFAGLIEVPAFGVALPLGNNWDSAGISRYPCRFWGSVYDNSLIVGGTDGKGQLDFCGKLDLGDRITVTDMTGTQFSYEVVRIDRRKAADDSTLGEMDCDLTLFARSNRSMNYIIVRCRFAP